MAHGFVPIAMMGEQFNPMDSLAQTAQLQAAYQQSQLRQMQIAEMQRQTQEANAQRMAARNAATYAPQSSITSPAQDIGFQPHSDPTGDNVGFNPRASIASSIAPSQTGLTLPQRTYSVQGPQGADFRNQYISQLGQLGQGQMIPGAQQEFAQQDMAKAKLLQEQQKTVDEHNASIALSKKNTSEAGKFDADAQAKHIDMMGAAANALLQLPEPQAQAAYPVTVAMLQSQGVDTSKFPPQFDRNIVGQAAQMAVSAKEQLQLKMEQQKAAETHRHNVADEQNSAANRAQMDAGAALSPQAVDQAAKLYLQTATLPSMGMGKQGAKMRELIMNRAAELGQGVDLANSKLDYGAMKSTKTYFTSGAGGKQLTAFNTAITHLDTLDKLAGDLGNGNVQVFNKAAQAWSQQTGAPAPVNFAAAVNAMSGEVAAALKASGATDQEIQHVSATFDRSQSPAQLKGAINTYRDLLKSKAQQLKGQYDAGMKGGANFGGSQSPSPQASQPMYATNPQTKQRIVSNDGGQSWQAAQ